jgi:multidrug efflux pump subunit AcrA (membrane-fusion protein)
VTATPTPAQELAAVKAERAALAAARAARVEAEALADQLAEQRRLLELETAVVEAEEKHGALGRKIAIVHFRRADESIAGSCILKKPNHQIHRRFQLTDTKGEAAKSAEIDKLFLHCLVWPSVEKFEALVEEHPGASAVLLNTIGKLAGASSEETAGK